LLRTTVSVRPGGVAILVAALMLVAVILAVPADAQTDPAGLADQLVKAVNVDNVNRHLIALQRIGEQNGGTRAASTSGHEASATYISDRLRAAGYVVQTQKFEFDFTETNEFGAVRAPGPRELSPRMMTGSANTPEGGLVAALVALPGPPADPTPGCEATDFEGVDVTGKIALISRGSCTSKDKADNALAAGATAVLIYNNATDPNEPWTSTVGEPTAMVAAGLPRAQGEALIADLATGPVTVELGLSALRERRSTFNVLAETPGGRADNVVMSGAHLDSVVTGPGINDNGSGSAAQLEVALAMAKLQPRNKVRFAWWGAEEFGMLGSRHYVSQLGFEQQLDIALYLNFDMIASPNFARFIYDGDDSDRVGAPAGPFGSAHIESVFAAFFDGRGLVHEGTDFSGRSDYGPFIAVAIPSGGLSAGAEGRKTEAQAGRYGGTAGEPFDKCYHQGCDTLGNINRTVLGEMAGAVAWAVGTYATDTSPVNGNGSADARLQRRQAALTAMADSSALTGAAALAAEHALCGHDVV
jgi:Zn-dependent M28 family amino/carboxypeptidase